jgi:DNA-binding NarL/FixJ family response regulator
MREVTQKLPVRVLIADDSGLFTAALEAVLSAEDGIEVVATAADGEEAWELARALHPAVVLMDISMPILDGLAATARITTRLGDVSVLMLTGSAAESDRADAKEAGAAGYVLKDRIADELVQAIRCAAAGCMPPDSKRSAKTGRHA